MVPTVITVEGEPTQRTRQGGPENGRSNDDWHDHFNDPRGLNARMYRLGMLLALAGISMLFLGFTSAYIVRHGLGSDWRAIALPRVLWLNTALLLASSLTFQFAGTVVKRGNLSSFRRWIAITTVLGFFFLVGQVVAWRELRAEGIYLDTNPNSSFFYLLTGSHAVHLISGLLALLWISVIGWRSGRSPWVDKKRVQNCQTATSVTALYWHFLDGLWIYLFVLLLVWR